MGPAAHGHVRGGKPSDQRAAPAGVRGAGPSEKRGAAERDASVRCEVDWSQWGQHVRLVRAGCARLFFFPRVCLLRGTMGVRAEKALQ